MHSKNKIKSKLKSFWKKLGPGLITGASDDDPSGIATYSQAGAAFGPKTLWMALVCFPLMSAIQEMCARIGLVTSSGLSGALKKYYPKYILYTMIGLTFPAIVLNIGADIAAMGAVGNLLFPTIEANYFSVAFTVILLVLIIYLPYFKIAKILKYLCVVLLVYLIVPFFTTISWKEIAIDAVVPQFEFTTEFLSVIVAILGTTISPYLFFWQATMEVEEMKHRKKALVVNNRVINEIKKEIDFGMLLSVIVMFFIILTSGTVLYNAGVHKIETVEQAALSLKPLAGNAAYLLFAMGVIGTGLLAIPVLSGALSYMFSEAFNWPEGLDKKLSEAKAFYSIVTVSLLLGLSLSYVGISPVQALLYSAILYGLTAPVLIGIILHISNNKNVMGKFTNSKRSNILGFAALILMSLAALSLIFTEFIN